MQYHDTVSHFHSSVAVLKDWRYYCNKHDDTEHHEDQDNIPEPVDGKEPFDAAVRNRFTDSPSLWLIHTLRYIQDGYGYGWRVLSSISVDFACNFT